MFVLDIIADVLRHALKTNNYLLCIILYNSIKKCIRASSYGEMEIIVHERISQKKKKCA